MLKITNEDIDYAVRKVVTFALVNSPRAQHEKVESLNLMASAVGLEGPRFDHLLEAVKKYYEDEIGNIVLGIIIGLFMSERTA